MIILVCLLLFFTLLISISFFGYRSYVRPSRIYEQVGSTTAVNMPTMDRLTPEEPGLSVRVLHLLGAKVPISPGEASAIRRDLMAAGYRSERALYIYSAIRILSCAGLLGLALFLRPGVTSNSVLAIVIPALAAFVGYFGPSFVLDTLVARRHDRLREGLPDALDLMVVAVEAGVGLDEAIHLVTAELETVHREVSEEFGVVNLEIRAGKRRAEALHNLGERTRESEIRKLVAILIQTDRFGTSIADSLRVHSEFLRTKRRQEAEERAGKVGVKLVFPIFFLILPSMLVVAAGPGILQVFRYLFPMMRQFTAF